MDVIHLYNNRVEGERGIFRRYDFMCIAGNEALRIMLYDVPRIITVIIPMPDDVRNTHVIRCDGDYFRLNELILKIKYIIDFIPHGETREDEYLYYNVIDYELLRLIRTDATTYRLVWAVEVRE